MTQALWGLLRELLARASIGVLSDEHHRAVPNSSGRELIRREKRLGPPLKARLYLFQKKIFIIASVAGIAEDGPVSVLPYNTPEEDLGRCVCDHLLKYKLTIPRNLRFRKLREWEAFRVSRARSVKSFKAQTRQVSIDMAEGELKFRARPLTVPVEVFVGDALPATAPHDEIGRVLHRLLEASTALDENSR